MSYEYYIHTWRNMDFLSKNHLIDIIKNHPLFFREYEFNGTIRYEFRDQENKDIKNMPNFEIIIEDNNKVYILENANRDSRIRNDLEQYFRKRAWYEVEDLQE